MRLSGGAANGPKIDLLPSSGPIIVVVQSIQIVWVEHLIPYLISLLFQTKQLNLIIQLL